MPPVSSMVAALVWGALALAVAPRSHAEDLDLRRMRAALVMVSDPGCSFCMRWQPEVKIPYNRSAEGAFAPLIERLRNDPGVRRFKGIVYSPTFLVLSNGEEVGRIVGYQGPDLFWMELEPLMAKAGFQAVGGAR